MKNINTVQGTTALAAHLQQAKTLEPVKFTKQISVCAVLAMLSGYAFRLIYSAGNISMQEKNIIFATVALALLITVPIIGLNIYLFSRRRARNTTSTYSPPSSHSMKKEAVAWGIPITIVAVVIFLSWSMVHSLDLYKPVKSTVVPERVAIVARV